MSFVLIGGGGDVTGGVALRKHHEFSRIRSVTMRGIRGVFLFSPGFPRTRVEPGARRPISDKSHIVALGF